MAEADRVDVPGEEIEQFRRRDAELHRRMKWYLDRIEKKSPYQHTATCAHLHYNREPIPPVEGPDSATMPAAEAP